MTRVELRQIDQTFGGHQVLCGLDLTVASGQYVVLLGPSGCGKTTTLRIIAGLQRPDGGEVLFDEKPVTRIAPRHRDVSMMFQHDALYPHLSVDQSIRFALRGKLSPSEIDARISEAVALTRIESLLDRYPGRLSGGEMRRAALAKAIARRSSVRLLDEPLSALDIPVRHGLQDDILRWHATVPGTTIHVTHDGDEAMRMADMIAVLERGRVIQFAEPRDILAKPRTVSVARAIGTPPINLLAGRSSGGSIQLNDGSQCHVELDASAPDRDVLVGVRPDALKITGAEGSEAEPRDGIMVGATLLRARPSGRNVNLEAVVDGTTIHAVLPEVNFESSQTIQLGADAGDVHLFDAATGLRIEPAGA